MKRQIFIFIITSLLLMNKAFGQFITPPTITSNTAVTATGGSVGIGVVSPDAKLQILSITNQFRLANSTTVYSDINSTATGLIFKPSTGGRIGFGVSTPAIGIGFHSNMGSFMVTDPTSTTRGFQAIPSRSSNGDVPSGTTILSSITTIGEGLSIVTCGSGANGVKLGAYAYCTNAGGWKSVWETQNEISGNAKLLLMKSGGNVGIGTGAIAPDKLLTVKSTTANTQIAKFADDMRYIGLGRDEIAAFDLAGNVANLYLGSNNSSTFLRGNVGIGTNNPSEHFQVGDRFVFHDGSNKYLGYNTHFDGTNNVRLVNDYSSVIGFSGGDINFQTAVTGTSGSVVNATTKLIIKNTGEIGIGTNTPNKKLTVIGDASIVSSAVNAFEILDASSVVNFRVKNTGVVYAREVNVQLTSFPDYVFKNDYVLTPLLEVEKYITKNKHLKGFEPAYEYESNGMAVGEVVRLQQEKIEELTLYLIEQQKQLVELKKQMDSFKK